ncbi:uncharacterized protein LOC128552225 [Mercenaria mercenaria]|uniref:uncharacterized protein LOC128552225 n=1 Tax=Mercenaria mercenaria TaxID=6596 RepID=UPI00234E9D8E|nr:uncharacterized protein LOC128552225 [Mercenaria mercenaria]
MKDKPHIGLSPAERLQWYKNKKKEKNKQAVSKHRSSFPKSERKTPTNKKYIKYLEKLNKIQQKKEHIRQLTKERVRKFRTKQHTETESSITVTKPFKNRMQKSRAVKCVKDTIRDYTPEKRSEIISALISANSPNSLKTRRRLEFEKVIKGESEKIREKVADAVLSDVQTSLGIIKGLSTECRTKTQKVVSCIVGNNIEINKLQTALSNHSSLNRRLVNKGLKLNKKIISGEAVNLPRTRKTRKDKLSEGARNKIAEYWVKNSQPLNDKRKVIRERIGPKTYIEHPKHILTSTQSSIYLNFVKENPDIKIGQRLFESLKPYYIKSAKRKDRITCLCKQHVEVSSLFKKAKECRKSILDKTPNLKDDYVLWGSLSDVTEESLCPPVSINGEKMFRMSCLKRDCTKCGVSNIKLMAQELDDSTSFVTWNRYEYVFTGKKDRNGKYIKKQQFVKVTSTMKEMWDYIKNSLSNFPLHNFLCHWQRQQLHSIVDNLPEGHVVMVHDYSEDFKCELQDEIQSDYFSRNEVSIHVTVLYRHETENTESSSTHVPNIVKEYAFVIFESNTHDRDTIHHVRKLLIESYLKDQLKYDLKYVHDFTDGCSQQYKSKFCMRDVSFSESDFNCPTQRNYFETSHGKGEQDAAGSHVKNKAHMSVIRRECEIHNAKDLYLYLDKYFRNPSTSSYKPRNGDTKLKGRLFFYVEDSEIDRQRYTLKVKAVKENRKLHCIRSMSGNPGILYVRKISCYCPSCTDQDYENCVYKGIIDPWEKRHLN